MRFNKRSVVLLVTALLLGCTGLFAQTPTGTVTGTVLDSSGAVVPGAAVKATDVETNVVSEKDTNGDGAFTIINLLPGEYTLTVEKNGFKTVALPVFPPVSYTHLDVYKRQSETCGNCATASFSSGDPSRMTLCCFKSSMVISRQRFTVICNPICVKSRVRTKTLSRSPVPVLPSS